MSTIQELRKSLLRNWKLVCSLVGDALSGVEFAPFRLWLAPVSTASGGGWASMQPTSYSVVLLRPLCPLLSIEPLLAGGGCKRLG